MQTFLIEQYGSEIGITAHGVIGDKTTAAIRKYQAAHGLNQDGDPGPNTWAKMHECENQKIWKEIDFQDAHNSSKDEAHFGNPMVDDSFERVRAIKLLADQDTDTKSAGSKAA